MNLLQDFYRLKPFVLDRGEDVSGCSGVGIVADGVVVQDTGKAVVFWRKLGGKKAAGIVVYDSISEVEEIHGHEGRTKVKYLSLAELGQLQLFAAPA